MKSSIKRCAAWILVGILLFNLIPVNSTLAGEKSTVGEQEISVEEPTVGGQDVVGDEIADSDQDKTTEQPEVGDSASSGGVGTEDKQADSSEGNTSEVLNSTQANTTEKGNQNDSDVSDAAENGITENDTKGDTQSTTTEKSTEISDVTETQTDSKQKNSGELNTLSLEDELMTLDEEEPSPTEHTMEVTISEVSIDGNPVNPVNPDVETNDKTKVKKDSTVVIKLDYKIMNAANVKVNDVCTYSLRLKGITLNVNEGKIFHKNEENNNEEVGVWTYEDGILKCRFTKEEFLKLSNVKGTINLDCSINLDDVDLNDDGSGELQINDKTYGIIVDKEDCPDEVKVTKSIEEGPVAENGSENKGIVRAKYVVTIEALTDVDNVAFSDQMGTGGGTGQDYMWIRNIENIESSNPARDVDEILNCRQDRYKDTSFGGTIPHMDKGEVITITYYVHARVALWNKKNPNNSNEVFDTEKYNNTFTVTNRFGKDVSDDEPLDVKPIEVKKSGEYDETNGTVTWTIEIDNPYKMYLSNYNLTDNLEGYGEIYEDDFEIQINGIDITETRLKFSDFTKQKGGIALGDLIVRAKSVDRTIEFTEEKYIIKYTMKVKDTYRYQIPIKNYKNEVTVTVNNDYTDEVTAKAEVGIGVLVPLLTKEGKDIAGKNEIEWTITFTVPEGGLENPVIRDEYDNTMGFDGKVEITNPAGSKMTENQDYVVTSPTTGIPNGKSAFEIEFEGTLSAGTYTITYRTTYNISDNIPKYENRARAELGDKNGGWVNKTVSRSKNLDKRGVTTNSTPGFVSSVTYNGTPVQTWRLEIQKFTEMDMPADYYIEDMWDSSAYEYIEESGIKAHSGTTVANSGDNIFTNIQRIDISTPNTIRFYISDAIKYARDNNWKKLYITYQTKLKDEEAFFNSYDKNKKTQASSVVSNKAVMYKDNDFIDISPEVKATSIPRALVERVGNYDKYTAPYAEYAISVNRGSNDLLPGDTLVVTDTLPADFKLNEATLQVYHANRGSNNSFNTTTTTGEPLAQGEWSYTYNTDSNVLTITIPDKTEVIIKYNVTVNMEPGTIFDGENAENAVDLGISGIESSKDSIILEGEVYENQASAVATTADLTIHKYDKEETSADNTKGLAGAEFQVRMVDYDSATGVITDPAVNTPQGYVPPEALTTGGEGNCTVKNLYFDHLYKVVETKAPAGYVLDATPRYFVVLGHDNTSGKEDAKKLYPNDTIIYTAEDTRIMSIGNEKEKSPTTEATTEITTEENTTEEKTTGKKTTEKKTTEEKTTEEKTTTNSSKKTGDDSPIGALAGLMVFGTTAVVFIKRKKKKLINN